METCPHERVSRFSTKTDFIIYIGFSISTAGNTYIPIILAAEEKYTIGNRCAFPLETEVQQYPDCPIWLYFSEKFFVLLFVLSKR